MRRERSSLQRLTGLALLVLLPSMGASISVLDIMPEDGRTGVESEHHPGTHGLPHNHLICIQQAASQWVQTSGTLHPSLTVEIALPALPGPSTPTHSGHLHLPRSRAPPLA
jgi:hypothetical protein